MCSGVYMYLLWRFLGYSLLWQSYHKLKAVVVSESAMAYLCCSALVICGKVCEFAVFIFSSFAVLRRVITSVALARLSLSSFAVFATRVVASLLVFQNSVLFIEPTRAVCVCRMSSWNSLVRFSLVCNPLKVHILNSRSNYIQEKRAHTIAVQTNDRSKL